MAAIIDYLAGYNRSIDNYEHAAAITPADAPLAFVTNAVWVGGTGNLSVVMVGGETVTFNSVPAGYLFRGLRAVQIRSTGTTATNIVALG